MQGDGTYWYVIPPTPSTLSEAHLGLGQPNQLPTNLRARLPRASLAGDSTRDSHDGVAAGRPPEGRNVAYRAIPKGSCGL